MQDVLSTRLPLMIVMTTFFSVLALNIAVPAIVLAAMGLVRSVIVHYDGAPVLTGSSA